MGQWFESLSAHSHDRGERGQGDEGDPKTGDSRRAAARRTKRPAQPAQPAGARPRPSAWLCPGNRTAYHPERSIRRPRLGTRAPTFATKNRRRIPPRWSRYKGRRSVLASAASNRKAERPVNAMLKLPLRAGRSGSDPRLPGRRIGPQTRDRPRGREGSPVARPRPHGTGTARGRRLRARHDRAPDVRNGLNKRHRRGRKPRRPHRHRGHRDRRRPACHCRRPARAHDPRQAPSNRHRRRRWDRRAMRRHWLTRSRGRA